MPAVLMDGRTLAQKVRGSVRDEVAELGSPGLGSVGLATILVGDDPASDVYVRGKHKAAGEAGIASIDRRLPADTPQDELLEILDGLNRDDEVDGILVQLPLPEQIDAEAVLRAVDPMKDVDGFHPFNAGRLFAGHPTFVPATPRGVMAMLEEYGVELAGAQAVVLGRSNIVGKPVAHLLLGAHATVTICHSRTRDLGEETRRADVLVVAIGRPGLVTPEMVKPGAAVIDVGISRTDEGLRGDVAPEVAEVASFLTPVPGGVGPMTIAMLLRNTVQAARYRRELLAFP